MSRPFYLFFGLLFSAFVFSNFISGPANRGRYFTGAPATTSGNELTCSICHRGGSTDYGLPEINWTISETAGGDNVNAYEPGREYFVTVRVTAPDADPMVTPAGYGFQSVFLDDAPAPSQAGSFGGFDNNSQGIDGPAERVYVEHNQATPSGEWNFRWTAPATGFGNVVIYSTGNIINGNIQTSGDSGSEDRTTVVLTEAVVLPVELLSFTARQEKVDALLHWQTTAETDFSHFVVEHSTDGQTFTSLGTVPGTGAAQRYSFRDTNIPLGQNYYRLRQVDLDGTFALSEVRQITPSGKLTLTVYPNPASSELQLAGFDGGLVRLYDAGGKEVLQQRLNSGEALAVDQLAPGTYFLRAEGLVLPWVKVR